MSAYTNIRSIVATFISMCIHKGTHHFHYYIRCEGGYRKTRKWNKEVVVWGGGGVIGTRHAVGWTKSTQHQSNQFAFLKNFTRPPVPAAHLLEPPRKIEKGKLEKLCQTDNNQKHSVDVRCGWKKAEAPAIMVASDVVRCEIVYTHTYDIMWAAAGMVGNKWNGEIRIAVDVATSRLWFRTAIIYCVFPTIRTSAFTLWKVYVRNTRGQTNTENPICARVNFILLFWPKCIF